jgi:hypothetical protein
MYARLSLLNTNIYFQPVHETDLVLIKENAIGMAVSF